MLGALREQLKALPAHQRQQVITNISKLPDREKVELIQLLSEIDKRTKRDAAQGGFLDFIKAVYPGYKIGNHHRRLANLLEEAVKGDKKRIIVNIAPRHGKLLADETPVYTPKGWTTHGALKVGDYVYHPEGHQVKVVAVSEKSPANVRMEFTGGESIYCHEAHEWKVYNWYRGRWELREAQEFLVDSVTAHNIETKKDNYSIPPSVFGREKSTEYIIKVTHDPQNKIGHCIQVDSPDGLYVVGKDFITTHNSEMASYLFPAWFLGQYPDKKIIMATHTADLSVSFGRRVRDLVDSPDYREIFPSVKLNQDAKAAGQWNTSVGGQYYAVGVGGALADRKSVV